MATIRPFQAYRPKPELAPEVAAKPYDVLNSDEARAEAEGHPLSFLHVGKPEIDLDPSIDLYDPRVYEKARENLQRLVNNSVLVPDPEPYLYVYAQSMGDHTQYGLVTCVSVEEYLDDTIKKHELTRKDKEDDRTRHVATTSAHTGPIFLTYRHQDSIDDIINGVVSGIPEIDFTASDSVRHRVWVVRDPETIQKLVQAFRQIPSLYVADGHHRSASAARVGKERREANPHHTGDEEYNYFLAVLFPDSQLRILDYNRVVKDLNGLSWEQFLDALAPSFNIEPADHPVRPARKGQYGLYHGGKWYRLRANQELLANPDPVKSLDVAILQDHVLHPILGIKDLRTDKRIDFVGGIRGLDELERRVDSGEMAIAFSLYPTSVNELLTIADAGKIMPPKSTWFEPKLRDGLFVHFF